MRPDSSKPLIFKDQKNPTKKMNIIDITSGYNSLMALSDDQEVFVWGRRMGIYPEFEMTLASLERNGMQYEREIHQSCPRYVKNNLIFHKATKIFSSHFNHALITEKGELMIQGSNDCN